MINFKENFSAWLKEHSEKRAAKRNAMKQRIVNESINVVEYNGTLYFSHNNIPLIPVDDLKGKVTDVLPKSRAIVITWAEANERHLL